MGKGAAEIQLQLQSSAAMPAIASRVNMSKRGRKREKQRRNASVKNRNMAGHTKRETVEKGKGRQREAHAKQITKKNEKRAQLENCLALPKIYTNKQQTHERKSPATMSVPAQSRAIVVAVVVVVSAAKMPTEKLTAL